MLHSDPSTVAPGGGVSGATVEASWLPAGARAGRQLCLAKLVLLLVLAVRGCRLRLALLAMTSVAGLAGLVFSQSRLLFRLSMFKRDYRYLTFGHANHLC